MKYFIYCRKSQEAEDRQVMSIESQIDEINKLITSNPNIQIVEVYEEAYSAKKPGRPLFDEMMERIEKGHAQGIIAWHPDRLARNSVDGGQIIFKLDQGKLQDLKFCTYNFENSPEGKFMLNIIFSYSKLYVDSLSKNIKRGNATKIKNGWRPNGAPTGYLNCKETSTIIPDPKHFSTVREMYELLLTGNYTVDEIRRVACDVWHYKTPRRKTQGGNFISRSGIYRILTNPFYTGLIFWNGQLHEGKHKPIVTKSEFEKAQQILEGRTKKKLKTQSFAYSGVFSCGECGLGVTSERKIKPSGKEYLYHHCTRVHRTPKCTQPTINGKLLDQQVLSFLDKITIPTKIYDWLVKCLHDTEYDFKSADNQQLQNAEAEIKKIEKQLSNLTDLRLLEIVDDDEFSLKRQSLQMKLQVAKEKYLKSTKQQFTLEPLEIIGKLNKYAKIWYLESNDNTKQKILKLLCWNPMLIDKKALLQAKYPLLEVANLNDCLRLRAGEDHVGTENEIDEKKAQKQLKKLLFLAANLETIELSNQIRQLINEIEANSILGIKGTSSQ